MISVYVTLNSSSVVDGSDPAFTIPAIEIHAPERSTPAAHINLPAFCDATDVDAIVAAFRKAIDNAKQRELNALAARRLGRQSPEAAIAQAAENLARKEAEE